MKYFGTDGIRDKAERILEQNIAYRLGRALAHNRARIAVGKDVRLTSNAIEKNLVCGILDGGGCALLCGLIPTPALAFIAEQEKTDFAVMITASHNPPEYNGLKVFGAMGSKLSTDREIALDRALDQISEEDEQDCKINEHSIMGSTIRPETQSNLRRETGGVRIVSDARSRYIARLIELSPRLDGKEIVLDCAHGCFSDVAAVVLEKLGARVTAIFDSPDGELVNVGCGATNLEALQKQCGQKIGFAFDGDGDRVIAVADEKIIDGDGLLFAISEYYRATGKLENSAVVGTIMSGGGLEKELALKGITLHRADVGDKYVKEMMTQSGAVVGGENSGHIILFDRAGTGDGLLTALTFLEAIAYLNCIPTYKKNEQYSYRLICDNPREIMHNESFLSLIEQTEALIGRKGRLIVRPSGTENVVRITIEKYDTTLDCQNVAQKLLDFKNPHF